MRLLDIVKIYRIKDWLHYIGFFILGYSLYYSNINFLFILQIIEVSLLLSYAYSLNQFFDKKMKRKYIIFPLVPLFLALFPLAFFGSIKNILIISFIILVTLYSVPKIRLKSFPIICSFSNNIGFSIFFLLGVSPNLTSTLTLKFFFLLFFLQSSAQFIHEMVHMKKDKRESITTTAILLGKNRTKKLYSLFLVLASIVSLTFTYSTISFFLLTIPTLAFSSYFIISIDNPKIGNLREKYRVYGMITGLFFLLNNVIRLAVG